MDDIEGIKQLKALVERCAALGMDVALLDLDGDRASATARG